MKAEWQFVLSFLLIIVSTISGYLTRTRLGIKEQSAKVIMTVVAVAGYPIVGFMAIWGTPLQWADVWLPFLGATQATLMAFIALTIGRKLFPDRAERGVVGISCGIGNHGVTMAGFAVYLVFGRIGLGLNMIYTLYTFFALVLLSYTIAQHYSSEAKSRSIAKLMIGNLLHWRATGLYACLTAIFLTIAGFAPPQQIHTWNLLNSAIYLVIAGAYFSIGLQLHIPHIAKMKRAIICVIGIRQGVGLLIGLSLAGLTMCSPWPLEGLSLKVFLLQSSVPAGVLGVAVANMFSIKPREASAIFVVSSILYLAIGMPLVLWIFSPKL